LPLNEPRNLPMKSELVSAIPGLKRLLPRFRKVHLAVLGDLMLDRYLWGTAHRLSPEAAVPVVDFVSQNDCLGGAGNVAANLTALGAHVQAYGVVGGRKTSQKKIADDEAGAALRACLQQANIADSGVLADLQRITTVKTRVIARHQQIVRIDHERRDTLTPQAEEKLFRLFVTSLKSVDALVLSDYDKGLITDGFAERILHACHQFKVPVFVKPKTSRLFSYRGARAVVCNMKEAGFFVTRSLNDEKSVEEAGRVLLAHFGCAAVVITRGEKGMSIFEEASPRHLSIPATSFEVTYARVGQPGIERGSTGRQVFDVTGAGDTVLSVLSLAMAAGATLPDAAFLANTAAGVVVGKLGTASVSPAEMAGALDEIQF
jgi:rfaE bifunctional protein kinase chain/domain